MKITQEESHAFKKTHMTIRAINHKLRQQMFNYLSDGERDVSTIQKHFRLEQSVASQHLAILRKCGWVKTSRNGKFIYYSVNELNVPLFKSLANAFSI